MHHSDGLHTTPILKYYRSAYTNLVHYDMGHTRVAVVYKSVGKSAHDRLNNIGLGIEGHFGLIPKEWTHIVNTTGMIVVLVGEEDTIKIVALYAE